MKVKKINKEVRKELVRKFVSNGLEIMILFLAALTGIIMTAYSEWYWKIIIGIIGFNLCSYLIGQLKKQTINEYIYLYNKLKR